MRKKHFALLPLAVCPCGAAAQTDSISLDGVEVTAVAPGNSVASAVPRQQMGRGEMLRLGVFGIEDALKHVAGIVVKDYGGAGGMKTVSVRGIGAKHTAVVYDGIALTDCQTGEIDLSRYSLANMQRLELIIGDGDDIFVPARNMAAASTLQMDTDWGMPTAAAPTLRAGLTTGSWGMVEPSFYWRKQLGRRWKLCAQGDWLHAKNDYPFTLTNVNLVTRERRQNSRLGSGRGELNVQWLPAVGQQLRAKVYYNDHGRRLPGIVHLYTQDNDERLKERNAFAQVQYTGRLSASWLLKAAGKANWNASIYDVGIASGGIKSERYWQREYYATTSWLYVPTQWLLADYAIDYQFNNLNSTLSTPTSTVGGAVRVHPYRHSILQSLAVKVATGRLTATGRLLWSNYLNGVGQGTSAADAHRWSPSLAVSWQLLPARALYVRAFWKSIFRVPTFNELYYYHIGSTDLSPERTSQWNLGLTGRLPVGPATLQFTADGYVASVSDKIVAIPFNMFVWRMMNMARVAIRGLDLTAAASWHPSARHQLELTANYSLQHVLNHTRRASPYYNNQIAYVPRQTFAATLGWQNPWANVSATLSGMDSRWATNEHADGTRMAGFATLDLSAYRVFPIRRGSLTLRCALQNLLDKQYNIVAHYPMPGRSWQLSAGWTL